MIKLGIDAEAFSIQITALSEDNQIMYQADSTHHKKVKETAVKMLSAVASHFEGKPIKVCACGTMSHLLNFPKSAVVSEQGAVCSALAVVVPQAASAILLGAQKTMYLNKPDGVHYVAKKNSNCSAGTGAFFEEQALRLQISLEEISTVASEANSVPNIAGRCSVFSKTDMIHRMQEGIPSADILLGLCYALVRNYKASILRNQQPQLPVYLAGGVMKNAGVIRALKDLLALREEDVIIDEYSPYLGALGSALRAEENGVATNMERLIHTIAEKTVIFDESGLPPLADFCIGTDSPEYVTVPYIQGEECCLGIDVGSTSINLVLINKKREVIYYSYVKTLGKPLDIVRAELHKLSAA